MEYIILILSFFMCCYDFYKKRDIFSPMFIFNFMWCLTIGMYQLKFSTLQQDLSTRTLCVFLICILSYNIICFVWQGKLNFNKFIEKIKKKFKLRKNKVKNREETRDTVCERIKNRPVISIEKKINIAKWIAIIIFIIEIIYSRGVPLVWKLLGDSKNYFDFGITSINGAWHGLIICLGAYSIFLKRKDCFIYPLIGILILSRQVILSIIIETFIIYILEKTYKINIKKIIIMSIIILIAFLGFSFLGNIRSQGDSNIENVFYPREEFKNLPVSVKWGYSYMTFSVSNFNNLVNKTDGCVNYGASILTDIIPNIILENINIKRNYNPYYLILPNFTVSTYLPSAYLDFGISGVIAINMLIAGLGIVLYENLKKENNIKNRMYYAIYIHNIIFLFFINMFLYLPIMIQYLYIFILFKERKKK